MPQHRRSGRVALALLLPMLLWACQPAEPDPVTDSSTRPAAPQKAPAESPLRDDPAITCAARGGKIELTGLLASPTCILPTRDAGKFCEKADDCSEACLADTPDGRPRCAPTTPYFGCHTVMDNTGAKAIICTE